MGELPLSGCRRVPQRQPQRRPRWVVHGGPDFAVEIVSDGELPHAKLGFYAAVGTHELLVVTRGEPWALELFRLDRGVLKLAGAATPGVGEVVSEGVGVAFRLEAAQPRPAIRMRHPAGWQEWLA